MERLGCVCGLGCDRGGGLRRYVLVTHGLHVMPFPTTGGKPVGITAAPYSIEALVKVFSALAVIRR